MGDPFVSMGNSTGDPGTSLGESWVLGGDPGVQGYLIGIHGWTLGFFLEEVLKWPWKARVFSLRP